MASTQQHLKIEDLKEDMLILKDVTYAAILQTSAVNFDLLSVNEQIAIISSFAGLLNSLSFPIQIVIRSKRLDISSYISKLVEAQGQQTNPLLKQIMERYRVFVETIIRENEVLDKQFFVIVTVSSLELGVGVKADQKIGKAIILLKPRIDHLIRQLGRTGLIAEQLNSEKLIKLFYDIYNEDSTTILSDKQAVEDYANNQKATLASSQKPDPKPQAPSPKPIAPPTTPQPPYQPQMQATPPSTLSPIPSNLPPLPNPPIPTVPTTSPSPYPKVSQSQPQAPISSQPPIQRTRGSKPFIVEELPDEYGTV